MTMINGMFVGNVQPTDVVGGCIAIYKNLWPNVEETIDMVNTASSNESAYWEKAEIIGHGVKQDYRANKTMAVSKQANINNNLALQNIHNQFYTMLLSTSIPYAEKFGLVEDLWHEGYNMLKYEGGDEYKAHYDSNTHIGRVISAVCYLNDDYEGGELEFVNFGITIKPEKGTLLLFPSNYAYTHIAHPIRKGTKYALVTWLRDQNNF